MSSPPYACSHIDSRAVVTGRPDAVMISLGDAGLGLSDPGARGRRYMYYGIGNLNAKSPSSRGEFFLSFYSSERLATLDYDLSMMLMPRWLTARDGRSHPTAFLVSGNGVLFPQVAHSAAFQSTPGAVLHVGILALSVGFEDRYIRKPCNMETLCYQ